jgi:hypothetical protein
MKKNEAQTQERKRDLDNPKCNLITHDSPLSATSTNNPPLSMSLTLSPVPQPRIEI